MGVPCRTAVLNQGANGCRVGWSAHGFSSSMGDAGHQHCHLLGLWLHRHPSAHAGWNRQSFHLQDKTVKETKQSKSPLLQKVCETTAQKQVGDRTKPMLDRGNCVCSSWLMFLEHSRQMKIWVQVLCQLESQTPLTVTQGPFKNRVQFLLQTPCVEAEGRITTTLKSKYKFHSDCVLLKNTKHLSSWGRAF